MRLVEVVDIEQQIPIRCAETSEVDQMGIAAELGVQTSIGLEGKVGCHDRGRPSVEGECRGGHPSMTDRYQFGYPGPLLGLEDAERVGPVA